MSVTGYVNFYIYLLQIANKDEAYHKEVSIDPEHLSPDQTSGERSPAAAPYVPLTPTLGPHTVLFCALTSIHVLAYQEEYEERYSLALRRVVIESSNAAEGSRRSCEECTGSGKIHFLKLCNGQDK